MVVFERYDERESLVIKIRVKVGRCSGRSSGVGEPKGTRHHVSHIIRHHYGVRRT